ncbi:MAG TPA: SAM-dependent methyltransferase [Thermoanaerobaculia bacterium]|nr:SAM-dependent methyltransferase [Thermoanaerobaculia bacterium]
MEVALYHPESGYYARPENPVGRTGDYVTAPVLSPVFSFALGNLVREFVRRNEGVLCSIVDIGCGDGGLIRALASENSSPNVRFFGVDRDLRRAGFSPPLVGLKPDLRSVPRDGAHLILSNELYDAFPFARLVRRGEQLHELWVQERDGVLDWVEREAPAPYEDYFTANGIELAEGQFADVSLEWEAFHAEVLDFFERGLVVTIDYGYPADKLFHPRARRFGTAAAYAGQRVSRDLLANPGAQDLTAHVNFSDLQRAGGTTLFFDRLAKFLLSLGAAEHPLFRPVEDSGITSAEEGLELLEAREAARRLVLPDGIGEEMRVLVQGKNVDLEGWSFQRPLY